MKFAVGDRMGHINWSIVENGRTCGDSRYTTLFRPDLLLSASSHIDTKILLNFVTGVHLENSLFFLLPSYIFPLCPLFFFFFFSYTFIFTCIFLSLYNKS